MEEYRKADYVIHARYAVPGERIYNYLEDSEYVTDANKPIVLSGTADEEWTVTIDKLMSTYTYEDGEPISPDDIGDVFVQSDWADDDAWVAIRPIQDADAPTVFAYRTNQFEQVKVQTSWGEVLTANLPGAAHGDGDWIVYANDGRGFPDLDDAWIVNGEVFENTYVPA